MPTTKSDNPLKRLIVISFLCLTVMRIQAQDLMGLSMSNYGGLYRATKNPSTLGGTPYKWQLNMGTINSTISARYFQFFGRNSILYPSLASHSTHQLYGRSRTMGSITDGKRIDLNSTLHLPSLLVSLGKKQGIAFQLRNRGFVQGNGIPEDIKMLYTKRLDTPKTSGGSGDWGPFHLKQQSFTELALSYGVLLMDTPMHKFRAGATFKYLTGGRASFIEGSVDRYHYEEYSAAGENQIVMENVAYQAGYTHPVSDDRNYLNKDKFGQGIAFDAGVTYELGTHWYRDDEGDSRLGYVLRLAASVTDLGNLSYKTTYSSQFGGSSDQFVMQQKEMETLANRGPDGIKSMIGGEENGSFTGTSNLPAMLHLEADLQLFKSFFLHAAYGKNLNNTPNLHSVSLPGYVTLAPRWEYEESDYSFPVTFFEGKKKPTIGVTGRVGPVHLGFSNIAALLGLGETKATYGYLGVSLFHFKTRDYRRKIKWKPEWKR